MLYDSRWIGGEIELGRHWIAILGEKGTRLGAMEKRGLVGRGEKVLGLGQGRVLGSLLGWESTTISVVLDINKVDLHLLGRLDTNDEGRTLTGSNDFMGVVDRLEEETEGTVELLDDSLGEGREFQIRLSIVNVFCELGYGFGVGVGLEAETLGFEESLQFLIVCDDAIVDNGEFPRGVGAMRSALEAEPVIGERAGAYRWGWQLVLEGGPWVAHLV